MTQARNRYEILVQAVVDYGIYMLDPDGYVASWNAGAERIKGYTETEIIGQHFSLFYTPEDRLADAPANALRHAREKGRFSIEGWRLRKDGSRFWAMVVIDPIFERGDVVGFAKITRDMTAQRAAQMSVLESERRFRLLVEGVTDYAIYMLDPDGHITNWNAGAQHIKGYSAQEILGEHFSRFYAAEDVERGLPTKALETARKEGRYEAEGWRIRRDGSRFWASVVIDAIHETDGSLIGFAKITRDLTERREAELSLAAAQAELFQSQKMEAVGQLTGGLAHDFNNLLTGIIGSLDMIRARISQGRVTELERYVATAHAAATRAGALTNRLLSFARRQTLDPKSVDVNRLVRGMEEFLRRTVGPHIRVQALLASDLPATVCDPNQLENAILNLCINSRDAMPNGGRLTITTSNVPIDQLARAESDMKPSPYVAIDVTDTGSGMSREVVARAFDPFFTTKPIGEGTGLGLSMVYGFAKQSGGQVKIDSEVDKGTTVRICLPSHDGGVEDDDDHPSGQVAQRPQIGETVLIVDDEPGIRMLVGEALEEMGCTAIEAADGAAGLKLLQSNVLIDLLITDVGLPGGINGRQMADAARKTRPQLKVLFITGYAESAVMGKGLDAGMHLLTKPFTMEAIVTRITDVLAHK